MYSTSTHSTTSSSVRASSVPKTSERRVRVVRLLRPRRSAPAYGFTIRGGREYASGFFVTKVEYNSEAHLQGLKVGDQLISVNGYNVDDAVHKELVHYLASQNRLKIKVRHVGVIPVKDSKNQECLSWQFVSDRGSVGSEVSSSPTLCHDTERLTEMRISMLVPPRAKLGCGICKGPEWKPGIFVQFVREGGIAREAGLRPGDQILSCNGQDFANITFNEAISAMKVTGRLNLVIREGAGIELVSPESSGYNSSASSAAGERSPAPSAAPLAPPAALRRRLASVAEEAADRADRLTISRLKRKTWDSLEFDWKGDIHNFDAPSDIEPDYDCPSIPNNPHTFENKNNKRSQEKEYISAPSNRTIINLTEDGATIQCSYENQTPRKASSQATKDSDKKTIVVEVHHTSSTTCGKTHCNYPPPMKKDINSDSSSISSSNTLSSAIAEEFLRRKMNKKENNSNTIMHSEIKSSHISKAPENEKKKQHDALMDEFKKVHRKMFAHQEKNTEENTKNDACDTCNDTDDVDRQQTLPLRKLDPTEPDYEAVNHEVQTKLESSSNPPAPPPMPVTNGYRKNELQNGDVLDGVSKNNNNNSSNKVNGRVNGTLIRTPTPDYNTSYKSESLDQIKPKNFKDEKAEMDSLESFKLKQPVSAHPKPPSNYFKKAPNGTETMKKHVRPVSVTIGEYATGGLRKEPSKLDFLNGDKTDSPETTDDVPISNRLQSELVMTLSRSNLRKKTETVSTAVNNAFSYKNVTAYDEESISSLDKNFHVRYGNNLLPLPPSISIPKVNGIGTR